MRYSSGRRAFLLGAAVVPLVGACAPGRDRAGTTASPRDRLAALETAAGGRLGVAALDTADGNRLDHRGDERFALCSTFKVLAAAAVLRRSETEGRLLPRRIAYAGADLVTYSPVTEKHVGAGMTVAELCAAALQYSDNTAANLLLKLLGGPAAVTAFARAIGDDTFRLDRVETALNTAIPGDPRDTSTPAAMAKTLQRLALGDTLGTAQRARLVDWMLGNTTGATRIRAGLPAGWRVADKTGSGDYGTTNDLAVAWPPGKPPVLLAVYYTQQDRKAAARSEVIAAAAGIVADAFGHRPSA
jgi:beta-lactamase class A